MSTSISKGDRDLMRLRRIESAAIDLKRAVDVHTKSGKDIRQWHHAFDNLFGALKPIQTMPAVEELRQIYYAANSSEEGLLEVVLWVLRAAVGDYCGIDEYIINYEKELDSFGKPIDPVGSEKSECMIPPGEGLNVK